MAAAIPKMLRYWMMTMLSRPNLFLMKVPRLLKTAEERLAASPIMAICLPLSPCPLKMMPNREPKVQLMPTMTPQAIRIIAVLFWEKSVEVRLQISSQILSQVSPLSLSILNPSFSMLYVSVPTLGSSWSCILYIILRLFAWALLSLSSSSSEGSVWWSPSRKSPQLPLLSHSGIRSRSEYPPLSGCHCHRLQCSPCRRGCRSWFRGLEGRGGSKQHIPSASQGTA